MSKSKKMDSLSPNLFVKDIRATIEFYKGLGFHVVMSVPGESEGELVWAMAVCGNVTIMFQTIQSLGDSLPQINRPSETLESADASLKVGGASQGGGSLLLYIKLRNIRAFFEDIKSKVPIIQGLEKTFYGATEFSIVDNNNFVLTFAEDEAG
jgi:uncharacterized glyoxalase superfamily protein PhnB